MPEKKIIHAGDIVTDIRAGMTDAQLMRKYKLSAKGLQSAFQKLLNNGILTVQEIYGQRRSGDDTVIIDDMRILPRFYLAVAIPIYEPTKPDLKGRLDNVTERGVGLTGIESRIGETKTFIVPCDQFLKSVEHIWLEAKCIWSHYHRPSRTWSAGYQITKISPDHMTNLRKLIQAATLGT